MENQTCTYDIRNLKHLDLIICYRIDIHLALVEIILLIVLRLIFFLYCSYMTETTTRLVVFLMALGTLHWF